MTQKNIQEEKKGLSFKIKLVRELAKDKKGKTIYIGEGDEKEETFDRHDAIVLLNMLQKFDTKKHTLKQYKTVLNLLDKVEDAWRKDADELEISLDQGTLLKEICLDYFDLKKKEEEKISIPIFWGKTIINLLEQLGE